MIADTSTRHRRLVWRCHHFALMAVCRHRHNCHPQTEGWQPVLASRLLAAWSGFPSPCEQPAQYAVVSQTGVADVGLVAEGGGTLTTMEPNTNKQPTIFGADMDRENMIVDTITDTILRSTCVCVGVRGGVRGDKVGRYELVKQQHTHNTHTHLACCSNN